MISRGQCESSDVTGCLPSIGQQSECAADLGGGGMHVKFLVWIYEDKA
jgi:hypothetical protein